MAGNPNSRGGKNTPRRWFPGREKKAFFLPPHAAAVSCSKLRYSTVRAEQGEKESLAGSFNIAVCSTSQPHGNTFPQQHFVLATGTWRALLLLAFRYLQAK